MDNDLFTNFRTVNNSVTPSNRYPAQQFESFITQPTMIENENLVG